MDLALATGHTADGLRQGLTEREFGEWGRYVAQKGLPMQRLEYLLARILMILDLVHMKKPGTVGNLSDYLPGAKQVSQRERVGRQLAAAFGGPGIVVSRSAARRAAMGRG